MPDMNLQNFLMSCISIISSGETSSSWTWSSSSFKLGHRIPMPLYVSFSISVCTGLSSSSYYTFPVLEKIFTSLYVTPSSFTPASASDTSNKQCTLSILRQSAPGPPKTRRRMYTECSGYTLRIMLCGYWRKEPISWGRRAMRPNDMTTTTWTLHNREPGPAQTTVTVASFFIYYTNLLIFLQY